MPWVDGSWLGEQEGKTAKKVTRTCAGGPTSIPDCISKTGAFSSLAQDVARVVSKRKATDVKELMLAFFDQDGQGAAVTASEFLAAALGHFGYQVRLHHWCVGPSPSRSSGGSGSPDEDSGGAVVRTICLMLAHLGPVLTSCAEANVTAVDIEPDAHVQESLRTLWRSVSEAVVSPASFLQVSIAKRS